MHMWCNESRPRRDGTLSAANNRSAKRRKPDRPTPPRMAQRMRVEKENRGSLVIRLFGPLAIEDGARTLGPRDLGGARPKQVLEILLAARGHRVATDRLADLLWPRRRPQNTAGSLQTFVSALRRHLTPDRERARELVVTEAEAYRFATGLVDFDLDRFDGLVERSSGESNPVV